MVFAARRAVMTIDGSTRAAALAGDLLKGMALTKINLGAAFLMSLGILAAAITLHLYSKTASKRADEELDEPTPVANAAIPNRFDRAGIPLPAGAIARFGKPHIPGVLLTALSAENKWAVWNRDGTLHLQDLAHRDQWRGGILRRSSLPDAHLFALTFLPMVRALFGDAKMIISASTSVSGVTALGIIPFCPGCICT
jgi:hypothetical protein